MPKPGTLAKATLTEMWPGSDKQLKEQNKDGGSAKKVTVQFNPQTLKVSLSNQNAGGSQPGGSSTQFVGQGTTKLSLELWFDVQLPLPEGTEDPKGDVRNLTREVAYFMTPQEVTKDGQKGLLPPGVQFLWGTFLFKGTVDSIEETLEYFSEDGKPLRAGMTLSLSKQDLKFEFGTGGSTPPPPAAGPGAGGTGTGQPAGTQPLQMARAGDTVQGASARAGVSDWKKMAVSNGIENPRMVAPGALLNVSGTVSASGAAKLGLTGSTSITAPVRVTGTASLGASTSIGGGTSGSATLGGSASVSGTASARVSLTTRR